ncbi:MAG TPA: hypothetical protein VMV47_11325 [Bacteroidales bacterium]|nr:hypothetical protein [Bacteroidales bacterium]
MKKILPILVITFTLASCKGPGSGPLVKESFENKETNSPMMGQQHQSQSVAVRADIKIVPCDDCITIGRLMADKKSFSGKTITVKGVVTKINEEIMGKNWIHIQDGTEAEGVFDLTVTTMLNVSVGDTVTFEGKVTLDKDFGYGYFYSVLMEEGRIVTN